MMIVYSSAYLLAMRSVVNSVLMHIWVALLISAHLFGAFKSDRMTVVRADIFPVYSDHSMRSMILS
jgi:hypothetical protein